jgi:hypothetical protein
MRTSPRAIEPANRTWLIVDRRNSSTYRARASASKPGAAISTVHGASANRTTATTSIAATARVRMVWANRYARASPPSRSRLVKTGMNGAASPLATTTEKSSSGIWNAALKMSSWPSSMPYVRVRMRSRTRPMT